MAILTAESSMGTIPAFSILQIEVRSIPAELARSAMDIPLPSLIRLIRGPNPFHDAVLGMEHTFRTKWHFGPQQDSEKIVEKIFGDLEFKPPLTTIEPHPWKMVRMAVAKWGPKIAWSLAVDLRRRAEWAPKRNPRRRPGRVSEDVAAVVVHLCNLEVEEWTRPHLMVRVGEANTASYYIRVNKGEFFSDEYLEDLGWTREPI